MSLVLAVVAFAVNMTNCGTRHCTVANHARVSYPYRIHRIKILAIAELIHNQLVSNRQFRSIREAPYRQV